MTNNNSGPSKFSLFRLLAVSDKSKFLSIYYGVILYLFFSIWIMYSGSGSPFLYILNIVLLGATFGAYSIIARRKRLNLSNQYITSMPFICGLGLLYFTILAYTNVKIFGYRVFNRELIVIIVLPALYWCVIQIITITMDVDSDSFDDEDK